MSLARREVRKALAMSVTHSQVIFIGYLEFRGTCFENIGQVVPLYFFLAEV